MVDWLLHAGPMIAGFVPPMNTALEEVLPGSGLWAILSWPVLSFLDRAVVQCVLHATIGKVLFGLVAIQPKDGKYPTFGRLVKVWLHGMVFWTVLIIAIFGTDNLGGGDGDGPDFLLPAVRRRDITQQNRVVGPVAGT
jgi:hypothetical protein